MIDSLIWFAIKTRFHCLHLYFINQDTFVYSIFNCKKHPKGHPFGFFYIYAEVITAGKWSVRS